MNIVQELIHLHTKAATVIPDDIRKSVSDMMETETGELSRFTLNAICKNYAAAEEEHRPMCADTGLPRYYVKIGNESSFPGGIVELIRQLKEAVSLATGRIPLRSNYVDPVTRYDHGDNTGLFAPDITFSYEPDASWIDITTVHKGGLFGSDYRMLFPTDGIDGVKKFLLQTSLAFFRRGLSCQPVVIGVGLGGTKDRCFSLGKEAACLRLVGDRHPDADTAALESELLQMLRNSVLSGPMGFKGRSSIMDIHIEKAFNHTGGMPISVHHFCFAARRATLRIFPVSGDHAVRENPHWFTDFYRGIPESIRQGGENGVV